MYGVTITDRANQKEGLAFDLRDLLRVLGTQGESSQWRLRSVETTGAASNALHRLSDTGELVSGTDLSRLANDIDQTIDGYFEALSPGTDQVWLRINAIDGTAFDIETDDRDVLNRFKAAFKEVVDLPE